MPVLLPQAFMREVNKIAGVNLVTSAPSTFAGGKRGPSVFVLQAYGLLLSTLAEYFSGTYADCCTVIDTNAALGELRLSVPCINKAEALLSGLRRDKKTLRGMVAPDLVAEPVAAAPFTIDDLPALSPSINGVQLRQSFPLGTIAEGGKEVAFNRIPFTLGINMETRSGRVRLQEAHEAYAISELQLAGEYEAKRSLATQLSGKTFSEIWGTPVAKHLPHMPEIEAYCAAHDEVAPASIAPWVDMERRRNAVGDAAINAEQFEIDGIREVCTYEMAKDLRSCIILTLPFDFMYDRKTQDVVACPRGMVSDLIFAHAIDHLGPATYWHPQRGTRFALTEKHIEEFAQLGPSRPLPEKYQGVPLFRASDVILTLTPR